MVEGENSQVFEADSEVAKRFEELAESMVSEIKEGDQSEMESFESYVQRVRQEMISEMEEFKDNFLQGYEIILSELAEKYPSAKGGDKSPPPGSVRG